MRKMAIAAVVGSAGVVSMLSMMYLQLASPPDARRPPVAVAPPPEQAFATVRVFYATDRTRTGQAEPAQFYGSGRGSLELGFCDVSIPQGHDRGQIEAPSVWRLEFRPDPRKHVVLLNVEPVFAPRYLDALRERIQASAGREAFVFVHGYNNTFEDAALRCAQIAHDLKFAGAPILYSWPAQGEVLDYGVDSDNALWSEPHMVEFLAGVARETGAEKIHLIAHSMGTRVLTGALRTLAAQAVTSPVPEFHQVILAAPDIDAAIFERDIAEKIHGAAQRITIYASANDKALALSKKLHGYPRLGDAGPRIRVFPALRKYEVVDASEVETGLLGHAYVGDSVTVLDDLRGVLSGIEAGRRGLLPRRGGAFWTIATQQVKLPRRELLR